ncbi:hypothetical protein BH20GEM2_BH20GEM2_01190 [soil metagenome]
MAIEGPLRELALPDVFQLLDLSRKTGVLTFRRDDRPDPAVVRFERGAVVAAELFKDSGRIGHLLQRAGKVTDTQIEQARGAQRLRPERPLGALLIEFGAVSEAEVRRQLRFQIEETIFELMRWTEGYFRFEESPVETEGDVPVRVRTESLLMESARRIDEWSTLEPRIPHVGVVPTLTEERGDGAALELRPEEWEVLAEVDGLRTLKTIAAELGRSDFEVAKVLFGLVSTGLVEVARENPARAENGAGDSAAPDASDPLREAWEALAGGDPRRALRLAQRQARERVDPTAFLLLGGALGALGRWPESLRAHARAVALDPLAAIAHYRLGFAAARAGQLARAEEAWETYLRLPDVEAERRDRALRARYAAATLRTILEEEE